MGILTPRKIEPWNTALITAYKNVLLLHENLLEGLKVMAQDDVNTVQMKICKCEIPISEINPSYS